MPIMSPDKMLPSTLKSEALLMMSRFQYNSNDCEALSSCEGDYSLVSSLLNLKLSLQEIFQYPEVEIFTPDVIGRIVRGLIFINKRLFDYENLTPAIDLFFCFPEEKHHHIKSSWKSITCPEQLTRSIKVSRGELALLKKLFHCFALRTNGNIHSVSVRNSYT